MQFSFNPEAVPWTPRTKTPREQNGQHKAAGSIGNDAARVKPVVGDLTAFPSIGGSSEWPSESVGRPTSKLPNAKGPTYKSLLTAALAGDGQNSQQKADEQAPVSARSRASSNDASKIVSAIPAVSKGGRSTPDGKGSQQRKSSNYTSEEATHQISAGTRQLSFEPPPNGAITIQTRSADGESAAVAKGAYRGSPVTDVRLATEVNHTTVKALRSIGPSDFQAVREIGQGAFGKVYLVQSRTTRQRYAMKVLNKQRVLQKEQVAYAMSERNVMTTLIHPYLVTLRFAFQTNHRLFLVMDYIEGGHLWTHMKSGFLAEPVARVFAAEIVLALLHLHALGIAHRDLKPENILLDSDNHLRLTDFGLAKRDLQEDGRAHTMVGTIDYMAPEIVKGDGHGREVDWWSLGILLYEMLCARLPFAPVAQRPVKGKGGKGKDPRMQPGTDEYKTEVKKKILNSKVAWPKGQFINPVSPAAKNLIQRLLAKEPDARLTGEAVMAHEWFRDLDWSKLERREIPSPLRSSIFAGAPDKLSQTSLDMAPLESPCPRLAGYLFECDTPKGSPDKELLTSFQGFTYVHESELARAARSDASASAAAAVAEAF